MRYFILGHTKSGVASVEWDVSTGELVVRIPGVKEYSAACDSLKMGMVGGDEIVYHGRNFVIPKHIHMYFEREFPTVDLKLEYMNADRWCDLKNKKIKNATLFLGNWLKRAAQSGKAAKGGLVY